MGMIAHFERIGASPQVFVTDDYLSVREVVDQYFDGDFRAPTVCVVNEKPVLRANWETTKIKESDEIVFIRLPRGGGGGGGGSNPIKTVISVALMVAAAYFAPAVGVALFNTGAFGSVGSALLAGKILMGAVALGGSMLLNALLPSAPAQAPVGAGGYSNAMSPAPTYSMDPQTNQARLLAPIPSGYGRFMTWPDLASQPYWEFAGNEQYVYELFCIGHGSYDIEHVRIEDTAIWTDGEYTGNFEEVELQIVNPGDEVTLFPDNVETSGEVTGQELDGPNNGGTWVGPFVANTSGTLANRLGFDVVLPRGLYYANNSGGLDSRTVNFEFQAREVDDTGEPVASPYSGANKILEEDVAGWDYLASGAGTVLVVEDTEEEAPEEGATVYDVDMTSNEGDSQLFVPPAEMDSFVAGEPYAFIAKIKVQSVPNTGGTLTLVARQKVDPYTIEDSVAIDLTNMVSWQDIELVIDSVTHADLRFELYASGGQQVRFFMCSPGAFTYDEDREDAWIALGEESVTAGTNTPLRYSYSYDVDEARYECRARRTNDKDDDSRVGNDLNWNTMRAYLPEKRLYGDRTLLAAKIRASNNLSNTSAKRVNVIATRKLPIWDSETETWSERTATKSIAWALVDMLKADYGGRIPDSRIDLDQLVALDSLWTTRGDEFNFISASKENLWSMLGDTARAGRARPLMVGSKITFIRDEQKTVYRSVFTPNEIIRDSFSIRYVLLDEETPDDVIVEYFAKDRWLWNEVQCSLPDSLSERPARKKFIGIDNRNQAWREGMYEAAANRYRRMFVNFKTELTGRFVKAGDLISVSHPLPQWGYYGEVEAFDSETYTFTLSGEIVWSDEEGAEHYVSLRKPNGRLWGPCMCTQGAQDNMLVLDSDDLALVITGTGDDPANWVYTGTRKQKTSYQFGPSDTAWHRPCRVVTVRPRDNYIVEITAVVEFNQVHQADTGAPPDDVVVPTLPTISAGPEIEDIEIAFIGTEEAPVLAVSWSPAPGASEYYVQRSYDNSTWENQGTYPGTNATISVNPSSSVYIRVAAMGDILGPWKLWSGTSDGAILPYVECGYVIDDYVEETGAC